jgi:hypothetical protein
MLRIEWLRRIVVPGLLALAGWSFMAGVAARSEEGSEASSEGKGQVVVRSSGLRVYVDPLSGELISHPTAEQRQALSTRVAGAFRLGPEVDVVTFPLRGGGTGVFLDGLLWSSTRVHRHADGSLEVFCVKEPAGAPAEGEAPDHAHEPAPVR